MRKQKKKNIPKKQKRILTKSNTPDNTPYKLDNIKKAQFLKEYEKTGNFSSACKAIRISRQSVYDKLNSDDEFNEKKEAIDHSIDDEVENNLKKLTETNPTACIFWLCNRRGDKWKNVKNVEHAGKIDTPANLTDEDKKRFAGIARDLVEIKTSIGKK